MAASQEQTRIAARASGAATPTSTAGEGRLLRTLTAFDTLLLTLSCLSPVFSVYGVGSQVLEQTGTGAASLFLVGIGAAAIWAMVYAELGSAYPYAGGDYVGVGSILGPAAGFACLILWAAVVPPLCAYMARMIAVYLGQVVPSIPLEVVVFGSLAVAVGIALLAVRASAIVTGIFLAIEVLAVLALALAGFWHPAGSLGRLLTDPLVPAPDGHWMPVGVGAMAMGAVIAASATVGGNQAIAFGEELVEPHRNMGRVILVACMFGAVLIALPVIAVAWHSGTHAAIYRSPAPFSAFVASLAGAAAGRALSLAVALAIFNALIAQLLFAARLLYSFARDGVFTARINAALTRVHDKSGAPRPATVVVGVGAAGCCLLGDRFLLIFISGLVVYALGFVSVAVLVGRARGDTGQAGFWRSPLYPLAPVLGLALTIAFGLAQWNDADAGRPSLLILGGLLLAALVWYRSVLTRRPGGWKPQAGAGPRS